MRVIRCRGRDGPIAGARADAVSRSGCARCSGWVADSCLVNDHPLPQTDEPTDRDLESLVGQWLTVPDVAERLGVPMSRVRQMLADREVLGARIGERRVTAIPEKFFDETGPRPELRGTFTVLADGGLGDDDIIA